MEFVQPSTLERTYGQNKEFLHVFPHIAHSHILKHLCQHFLEINQQEKWALGSWILDLHAVCVNRLHKVMDQCTWRWYKLVHNPKRTGKIAQTASQTFQDKPTSQQQNTKCPLRTETWLAKAPFTDEPGEPLVFREASELFTHSFGRH